MFMHGLCDRGVISDCVFSFYLTGTYGSSYIDFGTPNPSIVKDSSKLLYLDIIDDDLYWTSKITGFRWGDDWDDKKEYKIPKANARTDTGTGCIAGPSSSIDSIMGTILNTSKSAEWYDE